MAIRVLQDRDHESVARIRNLPAAIESDEPVNLGQLDAAVGDLPWKDDVRVRAQANVTLSGPGASIDSTSMNNGDRLLLDQQASGSENGIYIFNGAATPLTRSPDMTSPGDFENAVVSVNEGSDAGLSFRQTNLVETVDTDSVAFSQFGSGAPAASETTAGLIEISTQAETNAGVADDKSVTPLKLASYTGFTRKAVSAIGDGSATSIAFAHNFATRDVTVEVYANSGNYDTVECEIRRNSTNEVTLLFATAPASNALRCVVTG